MIIALLVPPPTLCPIIAQRAGLYSSLDNGPCISYGRAGGARHFSTVCRNPSGNQEIPSEIYQQKSQRKSKQNPEIREEIQTMLSVHVRILLST